MDRRLWTPEEDQHIIRLVGKFGTKKWPLISQRLCAETEFERTGKQCRQRWYNHLNPDISSIVWNQLDNERLFEAHKQFGNKWKVISKLFQGRTDNSIKNHFYSTIRRCLRRINKFQGQKNSTLKMRSIKPYVLSKILADKYLTETILELGKVKPNKYRQTQNLPSFQEFNDMISKLFAFNTEYQSSKNIKRQPSENGAQDNSMVEESSSFSSSDKSGKVRVPKNVKKQRRNEFSMISEQCMALKKIESQSKSISPSKSPQKGTRAKRIRRRGSKGDSNPVFQQFKFIKLNEGLSGRRRKEINYMKLNEGILCQNKRQQIGDTCANSENYERRVSLLGYSTPMKKGVCEVENVGDLMDFQGKFDKEGGENCQEVIDPQQSLINNINRNLLRLEDQEVKEPRHFQIANPSPCFSKGCTFLQDLVVIGTQLKIIVTPKDEMKRFDCELQDAQRKHSQQNFIQEILQINFDPEFVQRYGQGSQQN